MRHSFQVGFSFGLTSGIITTLGLMVGLESSTNSQLAVIGGILTIAIADSMSDALGIHMAEEAEKKHTNREVWESTFSTFFCKFIVASSFILPVVFLDLKMAVIISLVWGFLLLSLFSYKVAKECCKIIWHAVLEHLIIAAIVVIIAHYVGIWINITFM